MKMYSKEFKLLATNVKKNARILRDGLYSNTILSLLPCLRASGEIGREHN